MIWKYEMQMSSTAEVDIRPIVGSKKAQDLFLRHIEYWWGESGLFCIPDLVLELLKFPWCKLVETNDEEIMTGELLLKQIEKDVADEFYPPFVAVAFDYLHRLSQFWNLVFPMSGSMLAS